MCQIRSASVFEWFVPCTIRCPVPDSVSESLRMVCHVPDSVSESLRLVCRVPLSDSSNGLS